MKILITGASGFVGSHLTKVLPDAISLPSHVDLRDRAQLFDAVSSIVPDKVVHLAAQSFVPDSFRDPYETFSINLTGTLNLLESLKSADFSGRFLYVGSADVYGLLDKSELPVVESHPLRPRNPYAVSKVAAEALCYQWSQTESFDVVLARPFNHIGEGQSDRFVISGFAKQVVEIAKGLRESVVEVGDIDVTRDFSDVRDIVEAYMLLLDKGKSGEVYNVCSGEERSIRSVLESLMAYRGVTAEIRIAQSRLRRSEQRRVLGSFEKIHSDLGWIPKIPFESTLRNILTYWERTI